VDFQQLEQHYGSILFDGWGTLYSESVVYPGAVECVKRLRGQGKNLRLLTNGASRPVQDLLDELNQHGFEWEPYEVISSGSLLVLLNEALGLTEAFYLGPPAGHGYLEAAGIAPVRHPNAPVVIQSASKPDPKDLAHAEEILRQPGARLIVSNPDVFAPLPDGSRMPVSGMVAYELIQKTGCKALYCGKPFPLIYNVTLRSLPPNESVLMVGDTLGTDIAGANIAGLDSALLLGRNVREEALRDIQYFLGVRPTYLLEGLQ
jgi:HAD superfamily hydrolase (TIGR01450 family)